MTQHKQTTRTLTVGGLTRTYIAYVPPGAGPFPVVIACHGGGGTAQDFAATSGLQNASAAAEMIVIYPQGYNNQWNVMGGNGNPSVKANINDINFIKAALADLATFAHIDPSHVYAVGFSDGGAFCYTLMAFLSQSIAAVVTACSVMWLPTSSVPPSIRVVPVWIWHGGKDTVCPPAGGHTVEGAAPPVIDTVEFWADVDGVTWCYEQDLYGGAALNDVYATAEGASLVESCLVADMGHRWPGATNGPQTFNGLNLGPLPPASVSATANNDIIAFLRGFSL